MDTRFPVVVERDEDARVWNAYVIGVPVYAQGATVAQTERAIRRTLAAYLQAHPDTPSSTARVMVAVTTFSRKAMKSARALGEPVLVVGLRSVAALIGAKKSRAKAVAARNNGRLGGRPRSASRR
jgi:hypothetical protein